MLLQTRLSTRPEKNAAAVLLPLLLLVPPHDSRPYFSLARHDSDPLSLLLPVNAFHLQIMLPVSPVSPLLPASPYSRHFQPLSCIPFRLCTACPFSSCHVQSLRKQKIGEGDVHSPIPPQVDPIWVGRSKHKLAPVRCYNEAL